MVHLNVFTHNSNVQVAGVSMNVLETTTVFEKKWLATRVNAAAACPKPEGKVCGNKKKNSHSGQLVRCYELLKIKGENNISQTHFVTSSGNHHHSIKSLWGKFSTGPKISVTCGGKKKKIIDFLGFEHRQCVLHIGHHHLVPSLAHFPTHFL